MQILRVVVRKMSQSASKKTLDHEQSWAELKKTVASRARFVRTTLLTSKTLKFKTFIDPYERPSDSFREIVASWRAPECLPSSLKEYAKYRNVSVKALIEEVRSAMQVEGLDPKQQFNIAFIGPSGEGKFTLINAIRGLEANDGGARLPTMFTPWRVM